ncbi:MAG: Rieske 2Fe-2S domain-containing protein [Gammaproteobacteria bacterium]|nr:Rieske 2Fe-2S domain-containing protein [Gammaproteobacteria bacterium]MCP5198888.1 Rieske 2Fe-2S domain-containing protein [Gammaproteobacteria bacterium]
MLHSEQVALAERLFEYIAEQRTATSDEIYLQPVDEYVSADVAAREQRHLFRERPLCVGLSGLLPAPGTYAVHDLSGLPLLLTRAEDGAFRAFLNVCRHRGARVAENCGRGRQFVCPYHAWTFGLDGRLLARPQDQAFGQAPRSTHGLTAVPAVERDGLLWVTPQVDGACDIERHLGGLSGELAAYDLAGFHHYRTCTLRRRMNWKLLVDTFLESYHFCVLHKNSICNIFYDNLTTFDHWGPHFRLVSARRTIEQLRSAPANDWNLLPHMVAIYVLFPNSVLVWQLDHIELWQVFPGPSADESLVQLSLYTPEPATSESAQRHWDKNFDLVVHVVEDEDFPVGEGIQNGFHAGAQSHITFGTNEPALSFYHRAITAAIA